MESLRALRLEQQRAERFGCCRSMISQVRHRYAYAWVPDEEPRRFPMNSDTPVNPTWRPAMAKNIADEAAAPTSEGVSAKHNVANINAAVVRGLNEVFKLDNEIADAKEKHVAPIQERRKKAMRTLKADTGINIQALEAHYKVMKLYRNADDFLEEEDAQKLRDDLKVVFDALHEGGQLDWVDAATKAEEPKQPATKKNGASKAKGAPAAEGSTATH